jgi:hypothetical protein
LGKGLNAFGDTTFGHLITSKIVEAGFVGCLCTNSDNCHGVVGNGIIVEREAFRTYNFFVAMVSFVLGGLGEDDHKGIGPPLISCRG